jgi:hypothetical protein
MHYRNDFFIVEEYAGLLQLTEGTAFLNRLGAV